MNGDGPGLWMVALLLVATWLTGCAKPDSGTSTRQVTVYTSVDDVFARPICEQFQRDTGMKVLLVPDTEETKSTGLVNRLIAEKARPQADVFWCGDPVRAEVLKRQGVLAVYRSPVADGLPRRYSDPAGYWTGFSARARVVIYNTDLVRAEGAPRSVTDLASPRFKGKACLANPLFGTTSMHAAALFEAMGDEAARKFFESLTDNGVKIVSSNGEVRRRVADGGFAIGLTDTDDARVAIHEGKHVGVVYPDRDGMGTLVVPNAVMLIAGGPHPSDARRFIDYLLRPETEQALARSEAGQMPVRSGVAAPKDVPSITSLRAMSVDYGKLADKLEQLSRGFLKDWVDRSR